VLKITVVHEGEKLEEDNDNCTMKRYKECEKYEELL